ncbi:hypothetical protein QR680_006307 [Steinernema hermaphroditum]|uniref:Elongin-C n=1 Tax=Steinernema hermaphroditum TaxID=289476 RepID=A0AA39HWH1_9BILA|nr:hypothetical protein QR680_006307 [Steinernema hermaphroditum]
MRSFDEQIHRIFFRWGLVAHNHRFVFFTVPLFLTAVLACGFYWIKEQTTIDPQFVFSPEDAPWRYELNVLSEHWPTDEQSFWPGKSYDYHGYVDVIVAGKEDPQYGRPNMLQLAYIEEVDRINKYIINNVTIPVEHDGKTYEIGFTDLCMSYEWKCYLNDHITMLMPKRKWGNFEGQLAEFASDIITREVQITYPIGWRGSEPIYFGALVGGPHISDEEGHFDYAKAVRLTYNVRDDKIGNVSYLWRKKLTQFLTDKEHPPSEILEFGMFHNESLPEGLQDVADTLGPRFVLTSAILFIFCVGSSIVLINNHGFMGVDWVRSKPILAILGLFCPLLAVASAFGLILWTGTLYNAIVNVSPFIVICIGVDDMFIMVAAWHRTNPKLSVSRRLAETLAEAAVAITITSLTDMLTFGIGCLTTLPGVRLFCLYTFWGITFTYIYQLTYFAAMMAYAGEMEDKGKHSLFIGRTIHPEEADTGFKRIFLTGSVSRTFNLRAKTKAHKVHFSADALPNKGDTGEAERKPSWKARISSVMAKLETKMDKNDEDLASHHEQETFVNKLFREIYGPYLLAPATKAGVLVIYLVYISFAIIGCAQIQEGLNPKTLVRRSFYLSDFYQLIDETFWEEGLQMQVVVNNPPDLFDPEQRQRFSQLMSEFENTEYTMKHNATMIWLNAYETKLQSDLDDFNITLPKTSTEWYERCREWLITAGGRRLWEKDMVWGKNRSDPSDYNHLYAFRFQVGLRNYKTPTDHTNSCKLMRRIATNFHEFNVTTFHEYYPFADQYLELKPALFRNCAIAVVCMLAVSLVMIPHYGAAFAIVAAIISIDLGVLGFMTLWGVRLESVSMITIIMSIGFSVDLSAHIAYAYVKAPGDSTKKAIESLETLGWPVFLGAGSTLVGIMVLSTVDATIVQIFFKTIFLVIFSSMAHGLVFLPILLSLVIPHAHDRTQHEEEQNEVEAKTEPSLPEGKRRDDFECASIDSKALSDVDIASDGDKTEPEVKVFAMAAEKTYGGCEGPNAEYVKLISCDGHDFYIKRELAMCSGTIKAMLSGPGQFEESELNVVHFRDIPSHVLHKVCQYLSYKHRYTNSPTEIPEFPLPAEGSLELLMAANFLDC